jgi:ActR/RegA family two-component response regulator
VSNGGNCKSLHFLIRQRGHVVAYCKEVENMMEVARSHAKYHRKKYFDFAILNFNLDDPSIRKKISEFREGYPDTKIVFLSDITNMKDFLDNA